MSQMGTYRSALVWLRRCRVAVGAMAIARGDPRELDERQLKRIIAADLAATRHAAKECDRTEKPKRATVEEFRQAFANSPGSMSPTEWDAHNETMKGVLTPGAYQDLLAVQLKYSLRDYFCDQ